MKELLILGSKDPQAKNDVNLLSQAIKSNTDREYSVNVVYFENLVFDISTKAQRIWDSVTGRDISEADLVIAMNWYKTGANNFYRDVALTVGLHLRANNKPVWNKEIWMQRSTTKLSTMFLLASNGFDIPRTIFSISQQHLLKNSLDYPFILKNLAASRGKDNYLINTEAELKDIVTAARGANQFLIQEYIHNDGDLRVICFNGQPAMAINRRRRDKNTHLNNTSLGAEAILIPKDKIDADIISDCQKICEIMGREMAGIDLIEANDRSSRQVFLEVNAIPQLTTGTYVEEKLKLLSQSVAKFLEN